MSDKRLFHVLNFNSFPSFSANFKRTDSGRLLCNNEPVSNTLILKLNLYHKKRPRSSSFFLRSYQNPWNETGEILRQHNRAVCDATSDPLKLPTYPFQL